MAEQNSAPAQPAVQPASQQPVEPQQVPTTPSTEAAPEQMKDRTRENFEKLLESNNRLYEQNKMLQTEIQQRLATPASQASVPQAPAPKQTPTQTQPQSEWDFYEVDPKTGETFINRDKLTRTMKDIQSKATSAEKQVQSYIKTTEEREIERQNQEAYGAYPELDPNKKDKFNKLFHQQVRGMLYDSFLNPTEYGGRPVTFKEAADLARGGQPTQPKVEPEAGQPAPGEALKEAGAAQVTSQPQNPTAPSDDEELLALRFATRMGSDEALARRLIHTEHILTKDAKQVDA